MRQPAKFLIDYWNALRGDRLAPSRLEIAPAGLAPILSEVFLLETTPDRGIRFRLAGTRICDQFGAELRGVNFLDLWGSFDRRTMQRHFKVLTEGTSISLSTWESSVGHESARFECLMLPLIHSTGHIERFIGTLGAINPPAWLGSRGLTHHRLVDQSLLPPTGPEPVIETPAPSTLVFRPVFGASRVVKSDIRQFRVFEGGLGRQTEPKI